MTPQPAFVPGLELAEGFFSEHVGPILAREFPQLRFSASLIADGSEVLGFDTPMSADHHWGPRVEVFVDAANLDQASGVVRARLARELPSRYRGYSTHFTPPDPNDHGVQRLVEHTGGPINHRVEFQTAEGFFRDYLGLCISHELTVADCLSFPSHKLADAVFAPIVDSHLATLARQRRVGNLDAVSDNTDVLENAELRLRLRVLFEP